MVRYCWWASVMTRKAASTNVGLRKLTKYEVKVSFTNYGVIILSNRVVALFFYIEFLI